MTQQEKDNINSNGIATFWFIVGYNLAQLFFVFVMFAMLNYLFAWEALTVRNVIGAFVVLKIFRMIVPQRPIR